MRTATCTPVDFHADEQFFGRDSGLLCRGFQDINIDCVVVMEGDSKTESRPDLIRAPFPELSKPSWWRNRQLDLVVLYAWGDPRYHQVASAIRQAGIMLVQNLDTAGLNTPYGDFAAWRSTLLGMIGAPVSLSTRLRVTMRGFRDLCPTLYERSRLSMLNECDLLAVVSEPARQSVSRYMIALGHADLTQKLIVAPHAVIPIMTFNGTVADKSDKVLAVGRWLAEDIPQKDPATTIKVLGEFLKQHPAWTAEIVGRGSTGLKLLTDNWHPETKSRLTLTNFVPRDQLVERYQQSKILLCASRFESFHISSAEALCCGCSIVVADHPLLASTGWFTTKASGTLARNRRTASLLQALNTESTAWHEGIRNPSRISREWKLLLDSQRVASSILMNLGFP